ncbi:hypothetical protein DMI69_22005 [Escherichia coli]|nr:hypothetical protein [Escherichia coli]
MELINKGPAYVDELTPEQIREYRGTLTTGKNSPYRDRSVERTRRCSRKCVPAVLKKVKPACVRRSTWLRRLS